MTSPTTRTIKLDTGERITERYERTHVARYLPADGEYEATWAVVEAEGGELYETYDSETEAQEAAERANWHEEE